MRQARFLDLPLGWPELLFEGAPQIERGSRLLGLAMTLCDVLDIGWIFSALANATGERREILLRPVLIGQSKWALAVSPALPGHG